jgi:hypothetical protein
VRARLTALTEATGDEPVEEEDDDPSEDDEPAEEQEPYLPTPEESRCADAALSIAARATANGGGELTIGDGTLRRHKPERSSTPSSEPRDAATRRRASASLETMGPSPNAWCESPR